MLEYQSPTELALLLYVFDSKFKSDTTTLFTNDFYNFLHRLAYIDMILTYFSYLYFWFLHPIQPAMQSKVHFIITAILPIYHGLSCFLSLARKCFYDFSCSWDCSLNATSLKTFPILFLTKE